LPQPYRRPAILDRGGKLLKDGKDEEAKAQFTLALRRNPTAGVHNEIAWKWFLRDKPVAGLQDAEKAVALAPNDSNILDTRGQIERSRQRLP